ncbi:uncharacterized protein [Ptychodera flava]|uniref:uncharacterized protein n=1 Tax=Ptychodera flava TaxID=63121 RepID=UPI003969DF2A
MSTSTSHPRIAWQANAIAVDSIQVRDKVLSPAGDKGLQEKLETCADPDTLRACEKAAWREQVQEFGDRTTTHGISYIVGAETRTSAVFWSTVFIIALACLLTQVGQLLEKYFNYDVDVEVNMLTATKLPFPSVTVCNTNRLRRSAVRDSVYRELLVFDSQLVWPYYVPCVEGDFQCADGKHCIKPFYQCDGTYHCPDSSDEQNCTYGYCSINQFRCKKGSEFGVCIPQSSLCDRVFDCYDGQDENDCECKANADFRCVISNECIPRLLMCDGVLNCRDGSDESASICPIPLESLPAINSSYWQASEPSEKAYLAADGRANSCYRTRVRGQAFWQLKLRRVYTIYSIRITHPASLGESPLEGAFISVGNSYNLTENTKCVELRRTDVATETFVVDCSVPMSGQIVSIVIPDNTYKVTLCEVEVLGIASSFVEIAEDKSASQSSQYRDGSAVKAVDGDDDPDFHHRSCMHTDFDYEPWWQVDLGESYVISDVVITNRNDSFAQRIIGGQVQVSQWASFRYYKRCGRQFDPTDAKNTKIHTTCASFPTARYVRIQIQKRREYLHICEVQVYGQVNIAALPNVAIGKTAQQSSTALTFSASNAVDGKHSDYLDLSVCSLTVAELDAWWRVDLASIYRVYRVVMNSPSSIHTVESSMVRVGYYEDISMNAPCGRIAESYRGNLRNLTCDIPLLGRYVSVQLEGMTDALNLCEVEVFAREITFDAKISIHMARLEKYFDKQSNKVLVPSNQTKLERFPRMPLHLCLRKCSRSRRYVCKSINFQHSSNTCWLSQESADDEGATLRHAEDTDYFLDLGLNKHIPSINSTICPAGTWRCGSGECIKTFSVCDTILDCDDSSDEAACKDKVAMTEEDNVTSEERFESLKERFDSMVDDDTIDSEELKKYTLYDVGFSRVRSETPPDWIGFKAFSKHRDYRHVRNVLKLTKDEVAMLGHRKEDMIVQCTFSGDECNMSAITQFQDEVYGNCYTFNNSSLPLIAKGPGSPFGLKMTLFTEQSEYLSLFSQESGVRVIIKPSGWPVLPVQEGFTVRPGTITSVGLTQNIVTRLGKSYGNCRKDADGENGEGTAVYSTQKCQLECLQRAAVDFCGCALTTFGESVPACRLLNKTEDMCRRMVLYYFHNDRISCDCPPQCHQHTFSTSLSHAQWPAKVYLPNLLKTLYTKNSKLYDITDEEAASSNLVRLEVYFPQLNYNSATERASYTWKDILSDVGGSLGLYIGTSIISLCELILFLLGLCQTLHRSKRPVQPERGKITPSSSGKTQPISR